MTAVLAVVAVAAGVVVLLWAVAAAVVEDAQLTRLEDEEADR